MKTLHRLLPLSCLALLSACNQDGNDGVRSGGQSPERQAQAILEEAATEVEAFTLAEGPFRRELLANGTLEAVRRANLKFRVDGVIKTIAAAEGGRVAAGQLLATLANDVQQHALQQAQLRVRKAQLEYEDQLLRLGLRARDSLSIPVETREIARLLSGLAEAELERKRAERELDETQLFAPFEGMVANMKARTHNAAADFDYVCTVVDDRELFAKFSVLEQELSFVRASQTLHVSPFGDQNARYRGKVSNINPQVDESGMVTVRTRIANSNGKLVDGMGVVIAIEQTVAGQLVVPKEAVLDRQGRKVVFTLSEDGTAAHWNYVETGMENSTQYTIENGLKPGDRVIYRGNFNLAHDKPVVLMTNDREIEP